jgi:hypothetical protein
VHAARSLAGPPCARLVGFDRDWGPVLIDGSHYVVSRSEFIDVWFQLVPFAGAVTQVLRPGRTVAVAPIPVPYLGDLAGRSSGCPCSALGAAAIYTVGWPVCTHTPTGVWVGRALRCFAGVVRFPVGWWGGAPPPSVGLPPHGGRAPTAEP